MRRRSSGRFRQNLFYRLNVFPVEVPALRKRKEDIPLLAELFLEKASGRFNRPIKGSSQGILLSLQAYDWPGNTRELMNVIERAVMTSRTGAIRFDLPRPGAGKARKTDATAATASTIVVPDAEIKRRERENILTALDQTNWRVHGPGGAAELLGIRVTTLAYGSKGWAWPSRRSAMGVHPQVEKGLNPDFPDAVVLDGMIRAGTPAIQTFLAVLTRASSEQRSRTVAK